MSELDEAVLAGNFETVEEARSAQAAYSSIDVDGNLDEWLMWMESNMMSKSEEERLAIAQWMLFKMKLVVPCDFWIAQARKRRKLKKRAREMYTDALDSSVAARARDMYTDAADGVATRAREIYTRRIQPVAEPVFNTGATVVNTGQLALQRAKELAEQYEVGQKLENIRTGAVSAGAYGREVASRSRQEHLDALKTGVNTAAHTGLTAAATGALLAGAAVGQAGDYAFTKMGEGLGRGVKYMADEYRANQKSNAQYRKERGLPYDARWLDDEESTGRSEDIVMKLLYSHPP